ncbi:DUF4173 domain-containing protein [Pullulanibacillus sp. KACC 23026]|uniref:DUF4153 domain-containing protein n=1 Tax=Pullulanibacillus sp. KACC 23026 TaxID=3028315 RepID=UPI0023B13C15|nr:DUF4173 domain-containing protein [Pullulanibacillus sp. KACC 23026]WEG11044.1 DUF4173 domain-containing protein [Pullulanibacillus sp. KACC 23026]
MKIRIHKYDGWFLLVCLGLGALAEEMFFQSQIGVSYLIFLAGFYLVFFVRFKGYRFTNKRLGYLIYFSIWFLALTYFGYSNMVFYALNILAIPFLVFVHLILVTSPKFLSWFRRSFIGYLFVKMGAAIVYVVKFFGLLLKALTKGLNTEQAAVVKQVILGLVIAVPLLGIILVLLSSADLAFSRLLTSVPKWLLGFQLQEFIGRGIIILLYTLGFFGVMQVAFYKKGLVRKAQPDSETVSWSGIMASTVLILLNLVYLLFTIVQFKYFFGQSLQSDMTYAEYARHGFGELMVVTLINLSILIAVVTFVKEASRGLQRTIQMILSCLVIFSGIMLVSSWMRLSMYEEAYGFTTIRILVHCFMVFLAVIFAYTLIKIWIRRLPLIHFYLIAALVFYVLINIMPLDRLIVDHNIQRYQATNKIDIDYLNQLSYTGVEGLIQLYKTNPDIPGLKNLLQERKIEANTHHADWRSYNLSREKAYRQLKKLEV